MAFNFPSSPTVNQGYQGYTWDGEKWASTSSVAAASPSPATALPLMDAATAVVGTTTKYAREDHVHPKIYAAPLDALAYSGMQINGSMEISQERGLASFAATVAAWNFVQDGYKLYFNSAPLAITVYPQTPGGPAGFTARITMSVTAGKAALAADDQVIIDHLIEGYRVARLAFGTAGAQPVSIGFWVRTTIPGTMTVTLLNGLSNRWYRTNIVITAGFTWEYKTLTVPGDVTGTWNKDNTIGMYVRFCFGVGTTNQSPANAWASTPASGTSATTNFVATTNNSIELTGLVVVPGIEVPSAERSPFIMRPYDQELLTCKRYWQATNTATPKGAVVGLANWYAITTGYMSGSVTFEVAMRSIPTHTFWNNGVQNQFRSTHTGAVFTAAPGGGGTTLTPSRLSDVGFLSAVLVANQQYTCDLQLDARL